MTFKKKIQHKKWVNIVQCTLNTVPIKWNSIPRTKKSENNISLSLMNWRSFCSNIAQHIGVAKVRMAPRSPIWRGAAAQGMRRRVPRFSTLFITRGIRTIPGGTFLTVGFNPSTVFVIKPGVFMRNPVFSWKTRCFHEKPCVFNKTTPWDKVRFFNKN